jgi:hypothetical protein
MLPGLRRSGAAPVMRRRAESVEPGGHCPPPLRRALTRVTSTARAPVVVASGMRVGHVPLARTVPHRPLDVDGPVAIPGLQPEPPGAAASGPPGPAARPRWGAGDSARPRGRRPCPGSLSSVAYGSSTTRPDTRLLASTRVAAVPASAPAKSTPSTLRSQRSTSRRASGPARPPSGSPRGRMRQLSQRPHARPRGSGSVAAVGQRVVHAEPGAGLDDLRLAEPRERRVHPESVPPSTPARVARLASASKARITPAGTSVVPRVVDRVDPDEEVRSRRGSPPSQRQARKSVFLAGT